MLQALLCDIATDAQIADLTEYASTVVLSPRLNRPRAVTVTLPGDTKAIRGLYADDGFPLLQPGRRSLKVLRDGVLRANPILWNVAPTGDENTTEIQLSAYDPLALLPKRFARDLSGRLIPLLPNGGTTFLGVTGAQILTEAISGSINYWNGLGFDGSLPIDITSGRLDVDHPPAPDLSTQLMDFPLRLSDLFTLLTNTGVFDALLTPCDTVHTGHAPGAMGVLQAVSRYGDDLAGSVHFDYATGDHSVSKLRRFWDMDELCNALIYYLGPSIDLDHWRGNIVGTIAGLEDFQALQLASRDKYLWIYEDIKVYDSMGIENSARPMFTELWKTEVTLRTEARQLLYLTPSAGDGCPFKPFDDYDLGDTVSSNLVDIVGPEAAGLTQRIYGFDITQDRSGPERVSEFIVSPDGLGAL